MVKKYGIRLRKAARTMTSLIHWDPFKEMDALQSRLYSLVNRMTPSATSSEAVSAAEWAPRVDIIEDEKGYLIKADLPEVRKEDLRITVNSGVLSISGERHLEKEDKNRRYHRIERAYGAFLRTFAVPEDADPAQVKAEFKDGVLRLTIAKDQEMRPKQINVTIA